MSKHIHSLIKQLNKEYRKNASDDVSKIILIFDCNGISERITTTGVAYAKAFNDSTKNIRGKRISDLDEIDKR